MSKQMSQDKYKVLVEEKSPNSPLLKDVILAFVFGGAICLIGELILNGYKNLGLDKEMAFSATSSTMVILGALFTGLGVYDSLAKYAGAGTIVPITGFANSIVSPAMEFKSEGLVLGLAVKMFTVAGPVLVYGITASVISGAIYYVLMCLKII